MSERHAQSPERNLWGRWAMVSAVVASVLAVGLQLLTIWVMRPPDAISLVLYASPEDWYAASYAPVAELLAVFGGIHAVPAIAAVVLGALGARRDRPVVAAVALGLGILNVILAILGFALIPVIADAAALAVVGR